MGGGCCSVWMCGCQWRSGGESRRFPSFWLTCLKVQSYIPSLRCESPSLFVILFSSLVQSDHALIHKAVHESCWLWLPLYMFTNTLLLILMGAVGCRDIIGHKKISVDVIDLILLKASGTLTLMYFSSVITHLMLNLRLNYTTVSVYQPSQPSGDLVLDSKRQVVCCWAHQMFRWRREQVGRWVRRQRLAVRFPLGQAVGCIYQHWHLLFLCCVGRLPSSQQHTGQSERSCVALKESHAPGREMTNRPHGNGGWCFACRRQTEANPPDKKHIQNPVSTRVNFGFSKKKCPNNSPVLH